MFCVTNFQLLDSDYVQSLIMNSITVLQ